MKIIDSNGLTWSPPSSASNFRFTPLSEVLLAVNSAQRKRRSLKSMSWKTSLKKCVTYRWGVRWRHWARSQPVCGDVPPVPECCGVRPLLPGGCWRDAQPSSFAPEHRHEHAAPPQLESGGSWFGLGTSSRSSGLQRWPKTIIQRIISREMYGNEYSGGRKIIRSNLGQWVTFYRAYLTWDSTKSIRW